MGFLGLRAPTSYRLTTDGASYGQGPAMPFVVFTKPHDSHPSLDHLILLVFEAVMEVVCVSLPGYIVASLGHFDADKQKFLANLNVMLFTPCLIFTKLASQLNAEKFVELAIIPVIFIIQTLVSYLVSIAVSKAFRFNKRASNFVTAMGVFGNSNSLPISLVLSLSQTLKGLHWDKIPGDNDDEVAARGILYLMIFQQLGQLVRWSWGYHVLLAPKDKYDEYSEESVEEGRTRDDQEIGSLIQGIDSSHEVVDGAHDRSGPSPEDSAIYEPAGRTPVIGTSQASLYESEDEDQGRRTPVTKGGKPANGNGNHLGNGAGYHLSDALIDADDDITTFPRIRNAEEPEVLPRIRRFYVWIVGALRERVGAAKAWTSSKGSELFSKLPAPLQSSLLFLGRISARVGVFLWEFMNPPLWAMLIAVIVSSFPKLQRLFFEEGSFIKNSVTSAVTQSAGVAVPLILVVLGANLARNTQKRDGRDPEEAEIGTRLMVASLISRMVLPTVIMAPILALFAKYVPISILDDPIFVIVAFLLTGAPSALQLAQICQINGVYENVMSRILFQSYVIWILPSTLILVMTALEVVEWAKPL